MKPWTFAFAVFALALGTAGAQAADAKLTVFAAASLTDALTEIGANHEAKTKIRPTLVFAGSSTLARQIENGAEADIFLSADAEWMEYLAERGFVQSATRKNLLSNRLVLIAPVDSATKVTMMRDLDLAGALQGGKLSIADPDSVPAGRYARQALIALGVLSAVESSLVRAENVRVALAYVARQEAPLGIVYETDARVEPKVRVVGVFPDDSHLPILYPVALTKTGTSAEARAFLDELGGPSSATVFEKFGFTVLK